MSCQFPKFLIKQLPNTSCHLFLGTRKSSQSRPEFWELKNIKLSIQNEKLETNKKMKERKNEGKKEGRKKEREKEGRKERKRERRKNGRTDEKKQMNEQSNIR